MSNTLTEAPPQMSGSELAALIEAFNDVTTKLTQTHGQLQAEIASLREQLEGAKEQAERARHLALLGEMAAGIAHEVRNPLGSIRLYAQILQEDLAAQPGPLLTAQKIDHSVQRLEHVVGDVLAFSRQNTLRQVELEAADVLHAAAESARGSGPVWEKLEIEITPDPQACTITADADLLRQALVNLIRNAAEAMAEHRVAKRRIELGAMRRRVRTSCGLPTDMVVFYVQDSGPGIPADVLPRLFEPFFTTRSDGTGLGLAIVHRIADAHGGRIAAHNRGSTNGKACGARFELLIPAGQSIHAPARA